MSRELVVSPVISHGFSFMGPYRIRMEEDGELIQSAQLEIGLGHRAVEACFEQFTYVAGNALADKVDYLAGPACNLAYSMAVERLSGIEVPEPAQYTRVLLLEMNRISSHLFFIAQIAKAVGAATASQFALREREKYADIFEMYCGSRIPFGSIRIGGVADKVTEGILYRVESTLSETATFIEELNAILLHHPVFIARLSGLAKIPKSIAHDYGLSGPNARSSGLEADLRRERPYAAYDRITLDYPHGERPAGDALERFRKRVSEIIESRKIIEKILRRIPDGNYQIPIGQGFRPGVGNVYVEVESPRGAMGVYIESNGGLYPSRVKFMPPSLLSLRIAPLLLREAMLQDAELILTSLDISFSEVDR